MDLRIWQTLAEPKHEELIRLAAGTDAGDVAAVARLRKACANAEVVRAALMLAEARRKAVAKFGVERAGALWADPQGVEMASSRAVADHKRTRIPVFLEGFALTDLCCGIGGDAMSFVEENDVIAVDRDPVRAWMAARNAGCKSAVADVVEYVAAAGPVHIDPARRDDAGRRSWRLDDMSPGIEVVRPLVSSGMGGALKLGPGVDLAEIERAFPGGRIEIISENGSLAQCVVWIDMPFIGSEPRHATLLRGSADEPSDARATRTVSIAGTGSEPTPHASGAEPMGFVHEPDDSVERAGLLGVLCEQVGAAMLHPHVGLLTSDAAIASPWLTAFEVLGDIPWNEKRVKAALEGMRSGIVEVKTRGKAVNPDEVQASLRGKGDQPLTVFVLRFDRAVRAIITKRLPAPGMSE